MSELTPDSRELVSDNSTGLTVFGVIHLIFGGAAVLLAMAVFAAMISSWMLVSRAELPEFSVWDFAPLILKYGLLAGWLITLGIGSLFAKRWARTLIVFNAWLWLLIGLASFATFIWSFNHLENAFARHFNVSSTGALALMGLVFTVKFLLLIAAPTSFILFYQRQRVRETCERRNPHPCWTDDCPPLVLAQALILGACPVMVLLLAPGVWAFPLFGAVLTEAQGAMASALFSGFGLWLGRATYRMDPESWDRTVLFTGIMGLSAVISCLQNDMRMFFESSPLFYGITNAFLPDYNWREGEYIPLVAALVITFGFLSLVWENRGHFHDEV